MKDFKKYISSRSIPTNTYCKGYSWKNEQNVKLYNN